MVTTGNLFHPTGAVNTLHHPWTSLQLTVSSRDHFDLRINGIAVLRDLPAEFALWQAAKLWRWRKSLPTDLSPGVGQA